jgi:hypothetical protein
MAETDLMAWGINVVNAEVMKQQRRSIRAKEEASKARHVCVNPKNNKHSETKKTLSFLKKTIGKANNT